MKDRKFDWLAAAVTFGASLIMSEILLFCYRFIAPLAVWIRVLYSGLTALIIGLCAFTAFVILNKNRKKIRLHTPRLMSVFTIIFLAALFVLGAIGQLVYNLNITTEKIQVGERKETEVVEISRNSDIIILVDKSGSMSSTLDVTVDACEEFINQLPSECRVGFGEFTSTTKMNNSLSNMDAQGKSSIISELNAMKNRRASGGTDFDRALTAAWDEFQQNSSTDRSQFIVMFTDGQDTISTSSYGYSKSIGETILDSNIKVYSVRINGNDGSSSRMVRDFIDFVNNTGGADTIINMSSYGSQSSLQESLRQIVAQLDNMVHGTQERTITIPVYEDKTEVKFTSGSVFFDNIDDINVLRVIVRVVVFIGLAILMQLVFFGGLDLVPILLNVGSGLLAALLATLAGIPGVAFISALAVSLGIWTLYSFLAFVHTNSDLTEHKL